MHCRLAGMDVLQIVRLDSPKHFDRIQLFLQLGLLIISVKHPYLEDRFLFLLRGLEQSNESLR